MSEGLLIVGLFVIAVGAWALVTDFSRRLDAIDEVLAGISDAVHALEREIEEIRGDLHDRN